MLTIENLYKSFGEKILFNNINCSIEARDRIGVIGVNGTGKSSFLKAISGIDTAESGFIKHAKDYQIEYLSQEPDLDPNLTVIEQIYYGDAMIMQVMRAYEISLTALELDPTNEKVLNKLMKVQSQMDDLDAWDASTTAKTVLTKLGITDFDKKITELSGGQKRRVAIAKALIQPADLLILDEPTNHLDNETVEWLEKYLTTYKGALLLVTHDRYFLNRVTNRIFELDKGNLYIYQGNYEIFLEKKAEREAVEAVREQRHANTLKRELAWLRRGAKARTTKQKARIDRVHDLKEETFDTKHESVVFQVGSTRLGNKVIELKGISKKLADKTLINDFSYLINKTDRLGIIGPNGVGKSTLLNMMANRMQPDAGEIEVGETVRIGYYTQGDEELDGNLRVIDYIKETAHVIYTKDGDAVTAEQMLEHFLFPRSEQWTAIRKLSGGEKRRLYLLKVLMTEPNVLFLDEPTNDLDTQTLSVLEEYLHDFRGVVITVSHDRYFLDRVVDRLLVFTGVGEVEEFYGNYSEYLEESAEETVVETKQKQKPEVVKTEPKKQGKTKLSFQEQKEWDGIEKEISTLEAEIEKYQLAVVEAGNNSELVQEHFNKQQELEKKLEAKMERWEELSLLVEAIQS